MKKYSNKWLEEMRILDLAEASENIEEYHLTINPFKPGYIVIIPKPDEEYANCIISLQLGMEEDVVGMGAYGSWPAVTEFDEFDNDRLFAFIPPMGWNLVGAPAAGSSSLSPGKDYKIKASVAYFDENGGFAGFMQFMTDDWAWRIEFDLGIDWREGYVQYLENIYPYNPELMYGWNVNNKKTTINNQFTTWLSQKSQSVNSELDSLLAQWDNYDDRNYVLETNIINCTRLNGMMDTILAQFLRRTED